MTILFVCSGNMHRSALAACMLREHIVRSKMPGIEVLSAGTLGLEGEEALPEARALAEEDGLDLSPHRSRALRGGEVGRADLILVMERLHLGAMEESYPEAGGRCRLLSEFAAPEGPILPGADIPDAIGEPMDKFRHTYGILRHCVGRLAEVLVVPDQDAYLDTIANRFGSRKGTPLPLAPADWQIVERWWQGGVPLWVILESIDEVFDRKERGGGRVLRLAYIDRIVERKRGELSRIRSMEAGPHAPGGTQDHPFHVARQRLETALGRARAEGRTAHESALTRALEEIPRTCDMRFEDALERLEAIEDQLTRMCREATPESELAALTASCEEELEPYRTRMTPEAHRATLARLAATRLRERHGVPELSTFL